MTKSIESAMRRGDIERFTVQVDGDIPQEGFKQRFFVELTDRRQRGNARHGASAALMQDFDSATQWPECQKMINDGSSCA